MDVRISARFVDIFLYKLVQVDEYVFASSDNFDLYNDKL